MYAATWLSFIALPVITSSALQPRCAVPVGHSDGEYVSGTREPKGGKTCEKQGVYAETTIRRCEPRYCCKDGCTCYSEIFESSNECGDRSFVKLSCFVEHKVSKFNAIVCCEGFMEDSDGICVEISVPGSSKTRPTLPSTAPPTPSVLHRLTSTQSSMTSKTTPKALTTATNAVRTSTRPGIVGVKRQRHDPEEKRSSPDRHLGLYVVLSLAMLGLIIGALILVFLRYRQRHKIRNATVVFTTPGYDNTIYSLPQPLHDAALPYDGASLPPPYEESPYDTIADVAEKKRGMYDDEGDVDMAAATGGSTDEEKKIMSTREEPQVSIEPVPCSKPDGC